MFNIKLSEKQYNYISLAALIVFFSKVIINILTYKFGLIGYLNTISIIQTNIILYLFIPLVLIIKILQWKNIIPKYESNPLSVIWPSYNKTNYPQYFNYNTNPNRRLLLLLLLGLFLIVTVLL